MARRGIASEGVLVSWLVSWLDLGMRRYPALAHERDM